MKKQILLFLILMSGVAYTQQESKVSIDSGNANEILLEQSGNGTSKKSDIEFKNSDSNKVSISQLEREKSAKKNRFWEFLTSSDTIISLLIGIPTLCGMIFLIIRNRKKGITKIFFLLFSSLGFGQVPKQDQIEQKSEIDVRGNANIIRVIQGNNNNIITYDLLKKKDYAKFLQYLETFPTLKQDIKKILQNTNRTLEIVKNINDEGIFNTAKFIEEIEKYIRENERLRLDNERLRSETDDSLFERSLREAEKKLKNYDNEGYQKILEDYKYAEKKKIKLKMTGIAKAAYLQARNSLNIFLYQLANQQIGEALEYEPTNTDYLFIKAECLFHQYKMEEAINCYKKLLSYNVDIDMQCITFNNIGLAYQELGDQDNAKENYFYSLELVNGNAAISPQRLGEIYNNLATIYHDSNDFSKALEYYQKDLLVQMQLGGDLNPETGTNYNNTGKLFLDHGILEDAYKLITRGLQIRENLLGEVNPRTATSYNNLALYYGRIEENEKAESFFLKAINIFEKVYGKNHPKTADFYYNFGHFFQQKQKYIYSLDWLGRALIIRESSLSPAHIELRVTQLAFALSCLFIDEKSKAAVQLEKLYFTDDVIAAKLYNAAQGQIEKHRYNEAIKLLQCSMEYGEKAGLKRAGEEWTKTMVSLGTCYCQLGDREMGINTFNEILAVCDLIQDGHDLAIVIKGNLVNCGR